MTPSVRTILPALALVTFGAACTGRTGGASPTSSGSVSISLSGAPDTTNVNVRFKPGEYRYSFNNVTATLALHGSDATMGVTNRSGAELGEPRLYVITGTDQRVEGTVQSPAVIPDGGDATFKVTFPPSVTDKTAGLIVLIFGDSNYGAFAPVAVTSPSGTP